MSDAAVPSDEAGLLYVQGLLQLRAGDLASAADMLNAALQRDPAHEGARRNLIRTLLATGDCRSVLQHADIALQATPDTAELHYARGSALNALGRPDLAQLALSRAVALDPAHAPSWLNLANACIDLDDLDGAERHCAMALRLDPHLAEAHASQGHLLTRRGALAEAIAACEAAIALRPDFAQAHWNLAAAALTAGDLQRGFQEYEWRKRHDKYRRDFVNLPGPVWDGSAPDGRTILVHSEQGFGDTIQFARYLPLIAARGGKPILACDPPLLSLLSRLPDVTVMPKGAPLPRYDAWIDQMSLPRAFGTTLATIPAAGGYLTADPARCTVWLRRLPPGPRIGVAWAGNRRHSNDRRRSMPVDVLAPLTSRPDISVISLQPNEPLPGRAGSGLHLADFSDTAALVACLDLVIAVDTAVVHLAGALGVPAWVLLPHAPDWRWLLGRSDSVWYSAMRLFRQSRPGDWTGVLQAVMAAIAAGEAGFGPRPNGGAAVSPAP